MKIVHEREQGCWLHPALFEVGKAVRHCRNLDRGSYSRPCKTAWDGPGQKNMWCENCVAHEALGGLATMIAHLADHSTCACEGCRKNKDFLEAGRMFPQFSEPKLESTAESKSP